MNATRPGECPKKFWGTLSHKPRWGLTWRGRLLVVILVVAAGVGWMLSIEPFLSVTNRLDAKILVVEGWVSTYAIRAGAQEFARGNYERVVTTGGPVVGSGGYINDYNTSASVGLTGLLREGVPADRAQMAPSRVSDKDRTYSSALALREWLRVHDLHPKSINVLTEYAHARRTQMLFQVAFGDEVKIGIIAVENPDYNPKYWWRCSDGVREILGETIAYLYAKILFHPGSPEQDLAAAKQ